MVALRYDGLQIGSPGSNTMGTPKPSWASGARARR